jgi:dolichyl-phosphate-mannose-protein mannosyltransferase
VVQSFTGPVKREDVKVFLLGNPFVWWLNSLLLILCPLFLLHQLFIRQRPGSAAKGEALSDHVTAASWLYAGWALHYLPFYVMGRALYVHHYYPALVFSTCLTGNAVGQYYETYLSESIFTL